MAPTKRKGDLAELKVAAHLAELGYQLAFPYGEDLDFDLILIRGEKFERVQVKHATSDGRVVAVRCSSSSLTNGKVRRVKRYTQAIIDWLAVYDCTTDLCLYIPARALGDGMRQMHIRLAPTLNGQRALTNDAVQFRTPELDATLIP